MSAVEREIQERLEERDRWYKRVSAETNRKIGIIYESVEARIEREIAKSKDSGKYHTKKEQKRLLKVVEGILAEFEEQVRELIWRDTLKVSEKSVNEAREDMPKDDGFSTTWLFLDKPQGGFDHKGFLDSYIQDQMRYVSGQTTRMHSQLRQFMREEGVKVFRKASLDKMSHQEAARQLASQLRQRHPNFVFEDRAGRRWNTRAYFEMLSVTILNNARRESYINEVISQGHDLVRVTTVPTKDECALWIGKILSLTGSTPGFPTYDEAKATKQVFHPRCRHSVYAYHGEATPEE